MKIIKRNIRYNIDKHHHGLFVKEARLRHGYRLTEVATEICDISYLSKIESGSIIPPPDIFEKIAEKLDIRFPSVEQTCPIDIFRKSLYQEDASIVEAHLKRNNFHHYEDQLINFFLAVQNDELAKAFTLKKLIDQYRHHFNEKEDQLFLLFSGLYFFKVFEWDAGKRCFKHSLDLMRKMNEEDPFLYFKLAKYYFQMQKTCMGFSYLERATTEFKKIFEKDWVFKCDILWCRESIKTGDIRAIERRLGELRKIISPRQDHSQWSSFFNILGMIYEKRGQNIQAEEYYTKSIELRDGKINEDFVIDAIEFHYRRQNGNQLVKLIEELDLSNFGTRSKLLIDFYYFKVTDETSEIFESFLRKDAIPFAIKGLDNKSVSLYTKELTKYYRNSFSHKKVADAYYKWEKFCEEVNLIGLI